MAVTCDAIAVYGKCKLYSNTETTVISKLLGCSKSKGKETLYQPLLTVSPMAMWILERNVLHALTSKRSNEQFQYCPAVGGDSSRWLLQQTVIAILGACIEAHDNQQHQIPLVSSTAVLLSILFQSEQLKQRLAFLWTWSRCLRPTGTKGRLLRRTDSSSAASWRLHKHKQTRVASGEPTYNNNPSTQGKRQSELWTRCELSDPCEARGEEEVAVYYTGRKLATAMFG